MPVQARPVVGVILGPIVVAGLALLGPETRGRQLEEVSP